MKDIIITFDSNIHSQVKLKHLIRAIEKNCEGYNEIILIGDKPEWIQGVLHIDFNSSDPKYHMKSNYLKLKSACMRMDITDTFYWVDADDIPVKFDARKAMRVAIPDYSILSYKPQGTEKITFKHTQDLMRRRCFFEDRNFFNKYPMSMSKERLRKTFDDVDFETKYGYCIKTMYANFNRLPPTLNEIEHLNIFEHIYPSSYERNN